MHIGLPFNLHSPTRSDQHGFWPFFTVDRSKLFFREHTLWLANGLWSDLSLVLGMRGGTGTHRPSRDEGQMPHA